MSPSQGLQTQLMRLGACFNNTSSGVPFPRTFHATVKSIMRRLFRVYAHLYNHHFPQLCALSIEGECNSVLFFSELP